MKKILFLLFSIISLSALSQGTKIVAPFIRNSPLDTLSGQQSDSLGYGGFVAFDNILSRNSFPMPQRKYLMQVSVKSTDSIYVLVGGLTNDFWYPLYKASTGFSTYLKSISGITASGDLNGSFPNPTVNWANGFTTYDAHYVSASALNGYVPITRTLNGKALSSNITLSTADVAASTDKNYITDAKQTVLNNTTGANSGDASLGVDAASYPITVTQSGQSFTVHYDSLTFFTEYGITYKKTKTWNNSLDFIENYVVGGATFFSTNLNTTGTVVYPTGFGYINFTTTKGGVMSYHTSVDNKYIFRDSFMCRRAGGVTYYVSSESGNNAWPGTSPDSAFRSIATACSAPNALTIVVMQGVYGINEWNTGNQTASMNFIYSKNAHVGSFLKLSTWARDLVNTNLVYAKDSHVTSAFTALYDRLHKDPRSGNFERLEPASSLAICNSSQGTYYKSNDTMWANYPIVPGNNYNSLLFQTNGRIVMSNILRKDTIYVDGLRAYGTLLYQMDGTTGNVPPAIMRDVDIVRSSGTFDVINYKGYEGWSFAVTIWQAGTGDGFNYHTQGNQTSADTLRNWEIFCRVLDQKGQADHDQASTLHNHSKCLTINCTYISDGDQVVHDIDTSLRAIYGCKFLSVQGESIVRASDHTQTYIYNTFMGGGATYGLYSYQANIHVEGTLFTKPFLFDITSHISK